MPNPSHALSVEMLYTTSMVAVYKIILDGTERTKTYLCGGPLTIIHCPPTEEHDNSIVFMQVEDFTFPLDGEIPVHRVASGRFLLYSTEGEIAGIILDEQALQRNEETELINVLKVASNFKDITTAQTFPPVSEEKTPPMTRAYSGQHKLAMKIKKDQMKFGGFLTKQATKISNKVQKDASTVTTKFLKVKPRNSGPVAVHQDVHKATEALHKCSKGILYISDAPANLAKAGTRKLTAHVTERGIIKAEKKSQERKVRRRQRRKEKLRLKKGQGSSKASSPSSSSKQGIEIPLEADSDDSNASDSDDSLPEKLTAKDGAKEVIVSHFQFCGTAVEDFEDAEAVLKDGATGALVEPARQKWGDEVGDVSKIWVASGLNVVKAAHKVTTYLPSPVDVLLCFVPGAGAGHLVATIAKAGGKTAVEVGAKTAAAAGRGTVMGGIDGIVAANKEDESSKILEIEATSSEIQQLL